MQLHNICVLLNNYCLEQQEFTTTKSLNQQEMYDQNLSMHVLLHLNLYIRIHRKICITNYLTQK